jgi:hypothetical protein
MEHQKTMPMTMTNACFRVNFRMPKAQHGNGLELALMVGPLGILHAWIKLVMEAEQLPPLVLWNTVGCL